MDTLSRLSKQENTWYLEEFTEIANQLLPEYLPTSKSHQQDPTNPINSRLVRYYTSQGLLDDPQRQGKYAIYTYRHLLQLLAVRRLMSEGIAISAIGQITAQKNNTELENYLKGDIKLEVNPALAFLESLKTRENIQPSATKSSWFHLEIISGLEVHLRSDFKYPENPYQQKVLKEKILRTLEDFITRQQPKKP